MPSILTHYWLAEQVKDRLPDTVLRQTIEKFPREFTIGANGPDLFFYANALPWEDQRISQEYNHIGSRVHEEKINEFYLSALNSIRKQEDDTIQLAMISYVAGHLCHWALDCLAHPFIYYRTDGSTPQTKYWHCRYEAMIDSYMIEQLKAEGRGCFPISNLLEHDEVTEQAITSVYQPALLDLWDYPIEEKLIHKTLRDFRLVLSLTYDPLGIWYSMIRLYELLRNEEWKYTSHFITSHKDDTVDIFNETHQKWSNPCDSSDVHHESLWELMEIARDIGVIVLQSFEKALTADDETELLKLINNRSYETGYSEPRNKKYYNPIY